MSAFLLLLRSNWKLVGIGLLVLLLGVQTARLSHAKGQLETARINLNECREGRKQDRAAYEQAQRDAAAKNQAEVTRIVEEQDRISNNVESDLHARLERLRSELRGKSGPVKGATGQPQAGSDGKPAPNPADPAQVCISSEQFLLGAEYEEKLDQWVKWWNEVSKVQR